MSENNPSENVKETEEVPGLPPIFSVAEARELGSRAYELLASKRSNDVERAEVCEVAGNVQYFVGQFYASLKSFEKAVKFRDRAVKVKTMEHAKNYLMLGLSQFRVGESVEACRTLQTCMSICKYVGPSCSELSLIAMSCSAAAKAHQKLFKEAIEFAKTSLEIAEKIYTKESPKVSTYVRILLLIFMRANELGKADRHLKISDKYFTRTEIVLFRAGFRCASGLYSEAENILKTYCDLKDQGKLPQSIGCYDVARADAEAPFLEAVVRYNLAALAAIQKDYSAADSHLQMALTMLQTHQDECPKESVKVSSMHIDPNEIFIAPNTPSEFGATPLCALSHVLCAISENQLVTEVGIGIKIQGGAIIPRNSSGDRDSSISPMFKEFKARLHVASSIISDFANGKSGSSLPDLEGMESVYSLGSSVLDDGSSLADESIVSIASKIDDIDSIGGNEEDDISNIETHDEEKELELENEDNEDNIKAEVVEADTTTVVEEEKVVTSSEPLIADSVATGAVAISDVANGNEAAISDIFDGGPPTLTDPEVLLAKNLASSYTNLVHLSSKKESYCVKSIKDKLAKIYNVKVPERAIAKVKKSRLELKKVKRRGRGKETQETPLPLEFPAPRAELCTVRAELFPLSQWLGPGEIDHWLEWSLAVMKGLGYGMFNHAGNWDSIVSYDYLREIRSRLQDYMKDTTDMSTRAAILATMTVMSMQLNLKADTEKFSEEFEDLAKESGDDHLRAIARRTSLDCQEWLQSLERDEVLTGVQRLKQCQKVLEKTKEMVAFAKNTLDVELKRDAYKRIMNVYLDIGQGPPPFGSKGDVEIFATEAELDAVNPLDIEDNEKSDLFWLRKFSRVRALHYFKKMKELAVVDA